MATFNEAGLDDVIGKIEKLGDLPDKVQDDMLLAGADVLIKAQKSQLARIGKTNRAAGTLAASIAATSPRFSADSIRRVLDVFPQGEHPHGHPRRGMRGNVRSAQVGFMLEYGTSKMPAQPWMRKANKKASKDVTAAQQKVWEAAKNGL